MLPWSMRQRYRNMLSDNTNDVINDGSLVSTGRNAVARRE